ncbi:hypothetical protein 12VC501_gene0047 [Vibrio phage 12VC501]|nr:hypothetical protein 12VC501_gene0047 [Vibrio phage 12VC501]
MKLIETYKTTIKSNALKFNYRDSAIDGWAHVKDMNLREYPDDPFQEEEFQYRITQTQGNSVA